MPTPALAPFVFVCAVRGPVFGFFGRELVIGDVDEVELVLLAFLLDQAEFQLDRMYFFEKFVVGMMLSE